MEGGTPYLALTDTRLMSHRFWPAPQLQTWKPLGNGVETKDEASRRVHSCNSAPAQDSTGARSVCLRRQPSHRASLGHQNDAEPHQSATQASGVLSGRGNNET